MSESASVLTANRPVGAPWPVPDAAAYLSVSARHLRRLIEAGDVKVVRLGRRVLIPADELNRIASQGCGTPE